MLRPFGAVLLSLLAACSLRPDPTAPPAAEALRAALEAQEGVWEGEYLYLDPSGREVDRHESRVVNRLEGDRWSQSIEYLWQGGRSRLQEFQGRIVGSELIFDHPELEGTLHLVRPGLLVFEAGWRSRPGLHVIETISHHRPGFVVRTWQLFEGAELSQVVRIEERRIGPKG